MELHSSYSGVPTFPTSGDVDVCQGVTPSNSKGGLPAPEAEVYAKREALRLS